MGARYSLAELSSFVAQLVVVPNGKNISYHHPSISQHVINPRLTNSPTQVAICRFHLLDLNHVVVGVLVLL
jgi:hypothetical protein